MVLVCGLVRIKGFLFSQRHMFKKDWTTPPNFSNYSRLLVGLMYSLRNQQTCTSNNHNLIIGGLFFNPMFANASL